MRILVKAISFFVLSFFVASNLNAQKPTDKKPGTTAVKFKPPKLYTFLGTYKDSVTVPVTIGESIVGAALKIYDDKKTAYSISSYQFMYKKKTVTEDENTGKVTPANSIASDRFKTTPLPQLWINKLREDLKAGDELYFFDVIAKDAKGMVMYASNLKIIIQ